jgi:hypothetical protein
VPTKIGRRQDRDQNTPYSKGRRESNVYASSDSAEPYETHHPRLPVADFHDGEEDCPGFLPFVDAGTGRHGASLFTKNQASRRAIDRRRIVRLYDRTTWR